MRNLMEDRLSLCEKNISETFEQIKTLQSRHQQLIGYKQAILDMVSDLDRSEENKEVEEAVESVNPVKKRKPAA